MTDRDRDVLAMVRWIRTRATVKLIERDAQALAAAAAEIEQRTGIWPRFPGDDDRLVADQLRRRMNPNR